MIDVTLDVSALVLPVLGTDACAVATRVQLVVGGDGVLLAAEHFNLLTWTTTGLLRRVGEPGRGRDCRRDEKSGRWWTLTAAGRGPGGTSTKFSYRKRHRYLTVVAEAMAGGGLHSDLGGDDKI